MKFVKSRSRTTKNEMLSQNAQFKTISPKALKENNANLKFNYEILIISDIKNMFTHVYDIPRFHNIVTTRFKVWQYK